MSEKLEKEQHEAVVNAEAIAYAEEHPEPTEEELQTLREIPDKLPLTAFLVILIELCERFTYYGLSGPFQNYIQFPDPGHYPADQPGALGRGQQTATALTTFFQFWCYITPIIGAVIADQWLGKYRAILMFACIYMLGLVVLTCTSIPSSIAAGGAFPGYIVAIIIIGLGTGGIKSNVAPLVAEQYQVKSPYVKTLKNGERVIVSPQATYQKIFLYFYWGINIGSLSAIATTELEKNVGFWPAFLLPTLVFIPAILIVLAGRKHYVLTPPRGSVIVESSKLIWYNFKINGWFAKLDKFDACKPSNLAVTHPTWAAGATWDDVFVDEFKRALRACIVFCWYPIFWLCYAQISNNLISMAATMQTGNVPNDIMQNIDPLFVIVAIPIMDNIVYPLLRRVGIKMGPIRRIALGFVFSAVAMGYTAGIQSKIYNTPPYFDHVSREGAQNDISAAYQIPSYCFVALSEIFASVTGNEYAYKKAPQSMKSIVMSLFLFTNCFASILNFALNPVTVEPKLTWMYTGIACAAIVCAILIFIIHGKQDKTDVEDDAIARTKEEFSKYDAKKQDKNVTAEFEIDQEKGHA